MTEICSIIHKCMIHGEKNYMNLDFSSPLSNNFMHCNSRSGEKHLTRSRVSPYTSFVL